MKKKSVNQNKGPGPSLMGGVIRCLEELELLDRKEALALTAEKSEALGRLPNDPEVARQVLESQGFVRQSSRLEDQGCETVLRLLEGRGAPAQLVLRVRDGRVAGGESLAFRTQGEAWTPLSPQAVPAYMTRRGVAQVWLRWPDGVDRSPFPRRPGKPPRVRGRKLPPETDCYRPFQPNPQGNSTGDCVVRGMAGVLGLSWEESLETLLAEGDPTVNSSRVYEKVLARRGFVRCKPLTDRGRRLDGAAFCKELDWRCREGERVLAHVGRSHVAAVLPQPRPQGGTRYKILDSWDSTDRKIGEFWVLPAKEKAGEPEPKAPQTPAPPPERFPRGSRMTHPDFGAGQVTRTEDYVLTVDFGAQGIRRLGRSWVERNCGPAFPPQSGPTDRPAPKSAQKSGEKGD